MVGLITQYGSALVFANVLIAMFGLPIPVLPTLIVAGALAAEGEFSALAIFGVVFIAYAISDATWYAAGRLYGRRVMKLLCQISLSPDSCLRQSEHRLHPWGRITLVLAKFVPGLSMIMPALAGTMRLSGWTFALLDGMGTALWAGGAISLGMLFHHEIGQLIGRLEGFRAIGVEAIGVLLVVAIATNWWQRHRF